MSLISQLLPPEDITTDTGAWYRAYSVYQALSHPTRAQWNRNREFVYSSVAYSVGLANAWRFAYVAYKCGRGAFLIPFLILMLTVGIPLLFLECFLGQFTASSPVGAFNFSVISKGIGVSMGLVSWLLSLYSVMYIVYPIKYLFLTLETDLPWAFCKPIWRINSTCVSIQSYSKFNMTLCQNVSSTATCPETSAEKFWLSTVVGYDKSKLDHSITALGEINWDKLIIFGFSWGLVFLCTISEVKGVAKVASVSAAFSYLWFIAFTVVMLFQDGAFDGLKFLFVPDVSTLHDPRVWSEAANQLLLTFGLGTGGQILLSSYNKFENTVHRQVLVISFLIFIHTTITAITVFCIIGHVAALMEVSEDNMFTQIDPGFILIIVMESLSHFPWANFWSLLFLLTILLMTLLPQMVFLILTANILNDRLKTDHFRQIYIGTFIVSMLLGIMCVTQGGIFVVKFLHTYVPYISLSGIGLAEVTFLSCTYGVTRFFTDIHFMLSFRIPAPCAVFWILICPIILLLIFLVNIYDLISDGSTDSFPIRVGGRVLTVIPLLPIPLGVVYAIFRYIRKRKWKDSFRPHARWGPRDPVIKVLYANWIKNEGRGVDTDDDEFQNFGGDNKLLDLRAAVLAHMRKDILLNRLGTLFHFDQDDSSNQSHITETTV